MKPEPKKPPLQVVLTIVGIGIQIIWIILQMQHWRAPDPDYMTISLNLAVTIALWVILGYMIARYRQSSLRLRERPLERVVINLMWAWWAALADVYERLDYDNRTNNSTRYPFHPGSWPSYGQPWSYVNARLYATAELAKNFRSDTEELVKLFGWTDCPDAPRIEESTVMVDFIRGCRELQVYLDKKKSQR